MKLDKAVSDLKKTSNIFSKAANSEKYKGTQFSMYLEQLSWQMMSEANEIKKQITKERKSISVFDYMDLYGLTNDDFR